MVFPESFSTSNANGFIINKNRALRGFFMPGILLLTIKHNLLIHRAKSMFQGGYRSACATLNGNLNEPLTIRGVSMGIHDKTYSEKRDFIRMKISAPLNAKLSVETNVIEGLCRDLSGGGMQVETDTSVPVGTELEVEISSGHGHNPTLKAKAKVVRSTQGDAQHYVLGLEIIKVLQ